MEAKLGRINTGDFVPGEGFKYLPGGWSFVNLCFLPVITYFWPPVDCFGCTSSSVSSARTSVPAGVRPQLLRWPPVPGPAQRTRLQKIDIMFHIQDLTKNLQRLNVPRKED